MADDRMIKDWSSGSVLMYHLDGVPWYEAPKPRRFHRHWVQTRGWIGLDCVERCACGALRNPRFGKGWLRR